MANIDEMLERMILSLDQKIENGFDRINNKLESYYATREQFRYVILLVVMIFFLVLTLHGLGGIVEKVVPLFVGG